MDAIRIILTEAGNRGRSGQLPYAGAVTPAEAYTLLQANPKVKLIDVRTNAERDWVGRAAVPAEQHAGIEWNVYPAGSQNPGFIEQLKQVAAPDDVLLFLCRSGVRSRAAAALATQHGYAQSYDILEGFEGNKDENGHRKTVGGWCKAGLPWVGA
ncbi:MAG TPA: rhodanese-like domain-containing protein [Burkholderiaceae bacterium]